MLNFFDLLGAAQGGTGLDALARQFGLSQDQAQRAFAALMPAFALGLQRNAATPNAFSNLMQMMGSGMPAEAQAQGKEALGQLFGPPELTRQVAEQASHWSGVSAQVLQQMMPIFAAALVARGHARAGRRGQAGVEPRSRGDALCRLGRDDARLHGRRRPSGSSALPCLAERGAGREGDRGREHGREPLGRHASHDGLPARRSRRQAVARGPTRGRTGALHE